MENLPINLEERITFLRTQGFSDESIMKSLIYTEQPGGSTAATDHGVHDDPANQDSIKAKQTAATVPASEHNKSDEMDDEAYKGMEDDEEGDEDEDGDGIDDEEEYKSKAKKSVKKSAPSATLDEYADTYLSGLAKSTPEMQSYLDISPALDGVAATSAEMYAGLAVEVQELRAIVKSLAKSQAAVQGDTKAIRKMVVDSHNTQMRVTKSLLAEQTLVKSQATGEVAGGIVAVAPVTNPAPLAKGGLLGESVPKNRLFIQERLEKAANDGEKGAFKLLARLDAARSLAEQQDLISRGKPEWFV